MSLISTELSEVTTIGIRRDGTYLDDGEFKHSDVLQIPALAKP